MTTILAPADIERIDDAARRILRETGVRIMDPGLRGRLAAGGAAVDEPTERVRLDARWIDLHLGRAPRLVTLFSRDGRNDLALGSGRVHFGNGGRVFQILDMVEGAVRPTTLRDVANTAVLVDALEHIRFYIIACEAHDLKPAHYHLNDFYQAFLHTSKHVMGGVDTLDGARHMFALASAVAGGGDTLRERPFVSVITNPISPLTFDPHTTEILEFCVTRGIPVTCAPAPIAGATAPASTAGTLAQLHAEALAGAALVEFLEPGAPVLYGAVASTMDLRTMELGMGSVEAAMVNSASVGLARRYGLPIYATAGVTDSKLPDIQAGFEKGVSNLLLGMAGADFVHLAAGMLDSGNSIAYEQYVIDDEILGMIERILRGITVTSRTLGIECIDRVGPGGNYVMEDHTVEHMLSEFFYPRLAVRAQYDVWTGRGKPTPLSGARALVEEYLKSPEPRLDPDTVEALRRRFPDIVEPEP